MGNVAQMYSALGRHSEALAMFESVVEFNDRVDGNTPDLGEGHKVFPPLLESVLELKRRLLPADHPDIGEGQKLFFLSHFVLFLQFYSHGMSQS